MYQGLCRHKMFSLVVNCVGKVHTLSICPVSLETRNCFSTGVSFSRLYSVQYNKGNCSQITSPEDMKQDFSASGKAPHMYGNVSCLSYNAIIINIIALCSFYVLVLLLNQMVIYIFQLSFLNCYGPLSRLLLDSSYDVCTDCSPD